MKLLVTKDIINTEKVYNIICKKIQLTLPKIQDKKTKFVKISRKVKNIERLKMITNQIKIKKIIKNLLLMKHQKL